MTVRRFSQEGVERSSNIPRTRALASSSKPKPSSRPKGGSPGNGKLTLRRGDVVADKYEIQQRLGEGGMGVTYKVLHLNLDMDRTLKLMTCDPSEEAMGRFRLEAQTPARLDNPGLAKVYDFGFHCGVPFIEMEYAPGRPLSGVLKGEPLSCEQIAELLKQICSALGFLHANKIIHRDVKPSNVIVNNHRCLKRLSVKVIDYGIIKPLDLPGWTQTNQFLGTVPYASWEQLNGNVDHRSDLFSLGVMLYQWLEGGLPFLGFVRDEPRPMEICRCPKLQAFVRRCLAKEPEHRPQSALQLWQEFERII